MTVSREYVRQLYSKIDFIYNAALKIDGWDRKQIKMYMDVGEYNLALDDLADIYLNSGKPVPDDLLRLFDALATEMGMVPGDEWEAMAKLRARS